MSLPRTKFAAFVLFFLTKCVAGSGGGHGGHHVHFKIHVPEIIKHHVHTKTVLIHVHTGPKKKEPPKEIHTGGWNAWSSYDAQKGFAESFHMGDDHKESFKDTFKDSWKPLTHPSPKDNYQDLKDAQEPILSPFYDSYFPQEEVHDKPISGQMMDHLMVQFGHQNHNGHMGYTYPTQHHSPYAVHEDVDDVPHNDIDDINDINDNHGYHEESHHKGLHSEMGHLRNNDFKNFFDDKQEEADFAEEGYDHEVHDNRKNRYYGAAKKRNNHRDRGNYKYMDYFKPAMEAR